MTIDGDNPNRSHSMVWRRSITIACLVFIAISGYFTFRAIRILRAVSLLEKAILFPAPGLGFWDSSQAGQIAHATEEVDDSGGASQAIEQLRWILSNRNPNRIGPHQTQELSGLMWSITLIGRPAEQQKIVPEIQAIIGDASFAEFQRESAARVLQQIDPVAAQECGGIALIEKMARERKAKRETQAAK